MHRYITHVLYLELPKDGVVYRQISPICTNDVEEENTSYYMGYTGSTKFSKTNLDEKIIYELDPPFLITFSHDDENRFLWIDIDKNVYIGDLGAQHLKKIGCIK